MADSETCCQYKFHFQHSVQYMYFRDCGVEISDRGIVYVYLLVYCMSL